MKEHSSAYIDDNVDGDDGDNNSNDNDDNCNGDENDRNNSQRTKYQYCVGIFPVHLHLLRHFNRTSGKAQSRNVKHMQRFVIKDFLMYMF